jgi:hypothetical protein
MQENPPEAMSVTEHVREAWRLLLQLPDGEREQVTEHLAGRYAWSEVEAGATAMRHASVGEELTSARTDAMRAATDLAKAEDELAEITANLTPTDVGKVRNLVEALRDGVVTVAELHGLPDREWMDLIASRRAA